MRDSIESSPPKRTVTEEETSCLLIENLLIRQADVSEQKELEQLQLRASLTNAGDRDALLAHPDAIELPLAQIAAGRVFVAQWKDTVLGFAAVEPRADGESELD